jgi:hypothetical protein
VQRYFFDRVSRARSEFDYRGCVLANVASATEMAELLAIELALDPENEWRGWAIKVRNAIGEHFATVQVQELDSVA